MKKVKAKCKLNLRKEQIANLNKIKGGARTEKYTVNCSGSFLTGYQEPGRPYVLCCL